jgi:hypothetical protein
MLWRQFLKHPAEELMEAEERQEDRVRETKHRRLLALVKAQARQDQERKEREEEK